MYHTYHHQQRQQILSLPVQEQVIFIVQSIRKTLKKSDDYYQAEKYEESFNFMEQASNSLTALGEILSQSTQTFVHNGANIHTGRIWKNYFLTMLAILIKYSISRDQEILQEIDQDLKVLQEYLPPSRDVDNINF